jgi:methylenetetrahydrofolate dehydrogenase (NADP+)/methenyltetrahydrofolate cyclohydrolase
MLIDGKKVAGEIQNEIAELCAALKGRKPCLAVVHVGENPASAIYIHKKREACHATGIQSLYLHLPSHTSESELVKTIEGLNSDPKVDGILVQLPLPPHMNPLAINEKISPEKDVDGLHPMNMGRLLMGETKGFVPCTPLGIRTLLERSFIPVSGKHVAILGRSLIVGKPLAALLIQSAPESNASVTVLHSHSERIPEITRSADIVIVAIGKPQFLKRDMVKPGACVIDVGINRIEDAHSPSHFRIVGDSDFENLKDYCSAITPVPGGVGPMTIAMLLSNTLKSYQRSHD